MHRAALPEYKCRIRFMEHVQYMRFDAVVKAVSLVGLNEYGRPVWMRNLDTIALSLSNSFLISPQYPTGEFTIQTHIRELERPEKYYEWTSTSTSTRE